MPSPPTHLHARANWLIGVPPQTFTARLDQTLQRLATPTGTPVKILLVDRDPTIFLARFLAAITTDCHLFLGNPDWVESEWQQVFAQIQPDIIFGDAATHSPPPCQPSSHPAPDLPTRLILIPTGGSSGKIRFVMHTWETLTASVQGFQTHFAQNQINSACVLPLHHVSGLMQALRSLLSGGKLIVQPLKELITNPLIDPAEYFISLVPTQLQRLAQSDRLPWLAPFQTVLLGGAPAWPELLDIARQQGIRLAPTYGMTETASQIATLNPEAFLNGQSSCGQILPHAQIEIRSETGMRLPALQPGKITIASQSLALGYYPDHFFSQWFQPDDRGWLDAAGNLQIQGRDSDKIITGGENVFPIEVEATIRATGMVRDVCVLGIADRHWGQAITALYIPISPAITRAELQIAIATKLSKFKQPKHWMAVDQLPRNAQGKIDRVRAQLIISQQLQPPIV